MRKINDLSGNRFGRLIVINRAEDYISPKGKSYTQWLCRCDCGNIKTIRTTSLKSGSAKSCGCLMVESVTEANKKYNTYDLSGEYGIGYTSKGEEFYFDLGDYNLIKDYCWYIHKGYVVSVESKTNKEIFLHRLLFQNITNNEIVDHINHKTNDNRKFNLRIVSQSKNQMNKSKQSNNTSGVTGVYRDKKYNRWYSIITVNKNVIHLGYYDKFKDAVKARKEAEEKYFGEFSYDNSISN